MVIILVLTIHHKKPKFLYLIILNFIVKTYHSLVVAVNTENSLREIDKEFYKEIPRLKLTLIP